MSTVNKNPGGSSIGHGLFSLYAAEAVNSIAGTLITVGLPFYTSHRFGWGARENFAIAALQGILYVLGALHAQKISRRWGREKSLLVLYAAMTAVAVAVGISASFLWANTAVFLVISETALIAATWPMLESLVSSAGEASRLSRRLGCYNIVWASTGALAVAACGAIIQHAPAWAFFGIVAAGHLLAGISLLCGTRSETAALGIQESCGTPEVSETENSNPAVVEAVARRHRLALWLSRIALPSTYVIVYSLAPVLPSLHAIQLLSPTIATLVASIWLIARAAAFAVTGSTTFWHKRPGLMFGASITMLFAFIGVVVSGTMAGMDLLSGLVAMGIAQIILGISIGTIYSASLYFGMAVSEGSTEHGGYHEALIGLGQILGPLVGVTMQWIRPDALWLAVTGISGLVSITVVVQAIVGIRINGGTGLPPTSNSLDA